ncbi:MAG: hypothetical protein WAX89_02380 [Alphaproteobacteria bacterium]
MARDNFWKNQGYPNTPVDGVAAPNAPQPNVAATPAAPVAQAKQASAPAPKPVKVEHKRPRQPRGATLKSFADLGGATT